MATESDVDFIRNYFASYESESSSFDLADFAIMPENALVDCNCCLSCNFKFSYEARLLLRAGYQKLTQQGRTAFLAAHTREPSPNQTQCMLPIVGMGLEKVCNMYFLNTLQETRNRIRQVIRDNRETFSPEQEKDDELDCEKYIRDKKSRKIVTLERMARGLSYTLGRSKRVIPARKVKPPCNLACMYKCYERFPLVVRLGKLKELLQMSLAEQRQFLADHVCKLTPKNRRVKSRKPTKRFTIHYFFQEERKLHKVCKTMFLNTYDISDRTLRNLIAEKGAAGNVICGNPKLSNIIRRGNEILFDVDEGLENAEEMDDFEDFPIEFSEVKVEDLEPEMDETEDEILPDEPPADNEEDSKAHVLNYTVYCSDDKILSDCNEASKPSNVATKLEFVEADEEKASEFPIATVDIKTEMIEPESEQPEIMDMEPRDDDSIDQDWSKDADKDYDDDEDTASDSQDKIPTPEEAERTSEASRRRCKVRGLSYTTSSGRIIPARSVKPKCGATCLLQCYLRVSDEVRQQLLANLLKMKKKKQKSFIADHICAMTVVGAQSQTGRRSLSYHYFLPVDSRLVKVCKTMFLNTYDLAVRVHRIVAEKGAKKHVVCGNPFFPPLLKQGSKLYFNYDEGCEKTEKVPQDVWEEGCKCHLQCESKFTKQIAEQIRSGFRETPKEEHQNFLAKYVRLVVDKNNQQQNATFRTRFFLPLGSTIKEVCRKMFLRTFNLTIGQVGSLLKNLSKRPELLLEDEDPLELAKEHIAANRMNEEHHCAVSGAIVKLSRCPNVARMYNKYLANCRLATEPIDYQQYYIEFSRTFVRTGLQLPTKCPNCGFFDAGEEED